MTIYCNSNLTFNDNIGNSLYFKLSLPLQSRYFPPAHDSVGFTKSKQGCIGRLALSASSDLTFTFQDFLLMLSIHYFILKRTLCNLIYFHAVLVANLGQFSHVTGEPQIAVLYHSDQRYSAVIFDHFTLPIKLRPLYRKVPLIAAS